MRKLLIATRSKGKFPEIVAMLKELPFEFMNLNDIASLPKDFEIEESATTFEGNALIKAIAFGNKTSLLTLAEDSGLEIDALDGRPGVYTSRYDSGSMAHRHNKFLQEMINVPLKKRTARFACSIAVYDPKNGKVRVCEGFEEGLVTTKPKGNNGFDLDAIFYNETLKKTNAEMTFAEKNSVSHRGKALVKAKKILKSEFL